MGPHDGPLPSPSAIPAPLLLTSGGHRGKPVQVCSLQESTPPPPPLTWHLVVEHRRSVQTGATHPTGMPSCFAVDFSGWCFKQRSTPASFYLYFIGFKFDFLSSQSLLALSLVILSPFFVMVDVLSSFFYLPLTLIFLFFFHFDSLSSSFHLFLFPIILLCFSGWHLEPLLPPSSDSRFFIVSIDKLGREASRGRHCCSRVSGELKLCSFPFLAWTLISEGKADR